MTLYRLIIFVGALSTGLWAFGALAACPSAADRACVTSAILKDSQSIPEPQWRDQSLRDLASSLTYDGRVDEAIALIAKIKNPDTQAMTIRAIGMTAALYGKDSPPQLKITFTKLAKVAETIKQPDAHAIAFTYIAMAQAFAGLDEDAWATSATMTNVALQHKAYGETAEIQAERGDLTAAMKSIAKITTTSYRNKAYENVAEILIKKDQFDGALKAAEAIDNPMKRVQTMQEILKAQEEKTRGVRNDAAAEQEKKADQ